MKYVYHLFKIKIVLIITLIMLLSWSHSSLASDNKKYIALDADMSGNTQEAGLAIQRGIELALEEINAKGGVNGAEIGLKLFDHRGNPARGIHNIDIIAQDDDILAILGGVHTPVAIQQLPKIHEHKIPYLGAWAAGTPIVDNGYDPNMVFRLSVRDADAAPFFIQHAVNRGYKNIVLFLEKTDWGRSNHRSLITEAEKAGIHIEFTKWFFWGDKESDFEGRVADLLDFKTDAIILVANIAEAAELMKALSKAPEESRPPIISHWGLSAGNFPSFAGSSLKKVDLSFLQTWSPNNSGSEDFKKKYCARYGPCDKASDFPAPVGTAHAYDLTHLFSLSLQNEGGLTRHAVWKGLQNIQYYNGLIKNYNFPFTKTKREALTVEDFGLYRYNKDGDIIKIK